MLDTIDCRTSAVRFVHEKSVRFQEAFCHLSVDQIVIHHQHPAILCQKEFDLILLLFRLLRRFAQTPRIHNLLRNLQNKGSSLSVYAFHADISAHQFYQMSGNGQPQPGTFHRAVAFRIHLTEILKDFFQIFFLNAAAGILDFHMQPFRVAFCSKSATDGEFYMPLFGKLQPVIQQIDQNLPNPSLVAMITAGNGHIILALKQNAPLRCRPVHHIDDLIHNAFDVIVRAHQFHLACLYLGKVKNIIDKSQQISGRRFDIAGVTVYLPPFALLHDDIA